MKSYYDFMFFSTVCYSFKGFKCVIQKLEDPKNSLKYVRPKKIINFAKLKRITQKFANTEKWDLTKFQFQKDKASIPV